MASVTMEAMASTVCGSSRRAVPPTIGTPTAPDPRSVLVQHDCRDGWHADRLFRKSRTSGRPGAVGKVDCDGHGDGQFHHYLAAASGNGLVTIDEHESIEFANKTALTIDAGAGQDTISVTNPSTPAGLTGITVIGGDPSSGDTLNVTGAGRAVTVNTAALPLGTIDGATGAVANPVSIHFDNTIENLNLLAGVGDLTITTTG